MYDPPQQYCHWSLPSGFHAQTGDWSREPCGWLVKVRVQKNHWFQVSDDPGDRSIFVHGTSDMWPFPTNMDPERWACELIAFWDRICSANVRFTTCKYACWLAVSAQWSMDVCLPTCCRLPVWLWLMVINWVEITTNSILYNALNQTPPIFEGSLSVEFMAIPRTVQQPDSSKRDLCLWRPVDSVKYVTPEWKQCSPDTQFLVYSTFG